jgi:putative heme-binding domain-containing protein
MSSAVPHAPALADAIVGNPHEGGKTLVDPLLSLCVSLGRRDLAARLLSTITHASADHLAVNQFQSFAHFMDLLARHDQTIQQMADAAEDALAIELRKAPALFASARVIALNPQQPIARRAAAVALLGYEEAERKHDLERLGSLLDPATPGEVQLAAVKSLAAHGDGDTPKELLKQWSAQGPEARSAILDALLTRENWIMDLLAKIVHKQIPALDVDARHRDRMLKNPSPKVSSLAETTFASGSLLDRQKVIDGYRPALELGSNAARGKAVFGRLCVACHQLDGVGREIGPNLISVKAHSPEKLLTSILDPSREVEPRYLAYNCALKGGEELYGLIASETGNGIEFKLVDGSTRNVLRTDIKSLQSTKNSLMPDGLETGLSHQDAADLISYLRYQPGVD